MDSRKTTARSAMISALAFAMLAGWARAPAAANANAAPQAARDAGQTSPPGDIPDTQAFVPYRSRDGYTVLAPEGWSRTVSGSTVTFATNYNGERVALQAISDPAAAVRRAFPGVANVRVSHVRQGQATVTLVRFTSRSAADAVTGRSIALDNASYVFVRGSRAAMLSLWAPRGADNVDQWQKIVHSFAWR
ncbi:MAG: lipoprotein [Vulcanimicrobiaceae bacterium]